MANLIRGHRSFCCRLAKEASLVRYDASGDAAVYETSRGTCVEVLWNSVVVGAYGDEKGRVLGGIKVAAGGWHSTALTEGGEGVGILLSALFGTVNGSSVSVENAGLLALKRVGSRIVVQISAGFMIFFSILGKFGAVFASIPPPIVDALYCLFFAYVGARGLSFLNSETSIVLARSSY